MRPATAIVALGMLCAACADEQGVLVTATAAPGLLGADADAALELEWFIAPDAGDPEALQREAGVGDRYALGAGALQAGETLWLQAGQGDVEIAALLRRAGEVVGFGHVEARFAAGELRAYQLSIGPAVVDAVASRPADCDGAAGAEARETRLAIWDNVEGGSCLQWVDPGDPRRRFAMVPVGDRDCDGAPMPGAPVCTLDPLQCDPLLVDDELLEGEELRGDEMPGDVAADGFTSGTGLGVQLDGTGCGTPCVGEQGRVACDCSSTSFNGEVALADNEVNWLMPETCDGVDTNCDGAFDETHDAGTACIAPGAVDAECVAGVVGCTEAITGRGEQGCVGLAGVVADAEPGCPEITCGSREACDGGDMVTCKIPHDLLSGSCAGAIRLMPDGDPNADLQCDAQLWGYQDNGADRATLGTVGVLGFVPLGQDVTVRCADLALGAKPALENSLDVLVAVTPEGADTVYMARRLEPGDQVVSCELAVATACEGF